MNQDPAYVKFSDTLVYDQHNIIYAYGDMDRYIHYLSSNGFKEGDTSFPYPHAHHYHHENDDAESKLIGHWEWIHSPLQPQDEY